MSLSKKLSLASVNLEPVTAHGAITVLGESRSDPGGFAPVAKPLSHPQAFSKNVGNAVPENWELPARGHHLPLLTREALCQRDL